MASFKKNDVESAVWHRFPFVCSYCGKRPCSCKKNKSAKRKQNEIADYVSCVFGVANSAKIDLAAELAKLFRNNCHVCRKAPCRCSFAFVAKFKS